MNMKKILYLLTGIVSVLALSSCVQDEKDIFDASSSVRLERAVAEYKALLKSSPEGWFADYYPEADHSVGGYAMYLNFVQVFVDIACDTATNVPAYQLENSQWDVIKTQGPVLSFNTYNPVLNFFSEVLGSADLDGWAGDYEFVIMKVSEDNNQIELRGLKRNNKFILRRNMDKIDPAVYLDGANKEQKLLATVYSANKNFTLNLKGAAFGSLTVSKRTFLLTYTEEGADKTMTISYAYTPTGIRLYEPLIFDGVTMENFNWNVAESRFECVDSGVDASITIKK
jgi:hypothetical protein